MRACTPQTAPPVSIAIVRRSPIVRLFQIIVTPASAEARRTIGPSFSFGFPLTRERSPAHQLFEQGGDIGARAHPRGRPPLPERRDPPAQGCATGARRPRPRPRGPPDPPAARP